MNKHLVNILFFFKKSEIYENITCGKLFAMLSICLRCVLLICCRFVTLFACLVAEVFHLPYKHKSCATVLAQLCRFGVIVVPIGWHSCASMM